MTRLSLAQEYFHPWPNSAGFYIARERGWYGDLGIDVELRVGDSGRGDSLAHLARGDVDLAVFPSNRLLVRRDNGEKLRAVAAVNQRGLETLRTTDRTGIRTLADLRGKRIAFNPTPRGVAIVRALLEAGGNAPDDYELVDAGYRELDAWDIDAGLADATYGSYWAWDNLLTTFPAERETTWRVDEALGLQYHSYLLGASDDFIAGNRSLLEDFLAVTAQGFRYAADNQDEAAGVYERVTPYFPAAVIRQSVEEIAPTWFHEGEWGVIREELMAPYAGWLQQQGILRSADVWKDSVEHVAVH